MANKMQDLNAADVRYCQIALPDRARYSANMSLNLNIRAIRKERGLTIAQLASQIGISTPHMSEVERGVKNINNHILERVAVALRVPPEALIASPLGDDVAKMADKLRLLTPDDRARAEAFVDALLASQGSEQN